MSGKNLLEYCEKTSASIRKRLIYIEVVSKPSIGSEVSHPRSAGQERGTEAANHRNMGNIPGDEHPSIRQCIEGKPKKDARYFQVENKIREAEKYGLAEDIPLVT